jgi:hypothetical protein
VYVVDSKNAILRFLSLESQRALHWPSRYSTAP